MRQNASKNPVLKVRIALNPTHGASGVHVQISNNVTPVQIVSPLMVNSTIAVLIPLQMSAAKAVLRMSAVRIKIARRRNVVRIVCVFHNRNAVGSFLIG